MSTIDINIKKLLRAINTQTNIELEYSAVCQYSTKKRDNYTCFYITQVKRGLKRNEEGKNKRVKFVLKTYSLRNKNEALIKLAALWEENKPQERV